MSLIIEPVSLLAIQSYIYIEVTRSNYYILIILEHCHILVNAMAEVFFVSLYFKVSWSVKAFYL